MNWLPGADDGVTGERPALDVQGSLQILHTPLTSDGDHPMPTRIRRERTRGWRRGAAVIVDRSSRYGNPFVVLGHQTVVAPDVEPYDGRTWVCSSNEVARKWAAELHAEWLDGTGPDTYTVGGRTFDRRVVLADLDGRLRGRDLACTCPLPKPGEPDHCHARTLMDRANPTPG